MKLDSLMKNNSLLSSFSYYMYAYNPIFNNWFSGLIKVDVILFFVE